MSPLTLPQEFEGAAERDQQRVLFFKNSRQSRMSATIDMADSNTKAAATNMLLPEIPEIVSHDPVEPSMTPMDRHLRFESPAFPALTANDMTAQNSITGPQTRFGSLPMPLPL
ncbi:MAG TPA: hypothetical protein VFV01_21665 [Spirillospora sp.]|nr:hypothetical protein [Spirillospora sp.]